MDDFMKKLLALTIILAMLLSMVACSIVDIDTLQNANGMQAGEEITTKPTDSKPSEKPDDSKEPIDPETPEEPKDPETPEEPDDPETPEEPEDPETPEDPKDPEKPEDPKDPEKPEVTYAYTQFTPSEKKLFEDYVDFVIPFLPNNEYYVDGYYEEDNYEDGLCFYTLGNTKAEFDEYRKLYKDYPLTDTFIDETGEWYTYETETHVIDLMFYEVEGETCVGVFICLREDAEPDNPADPDAPNQPDGEYRHTDFSADEKALFTQYVGTIIPFLPNNEYYVEGYYEETDYENGLCFYTLGNTKAEFDNYRKLYSDYTLTETTVDEEGDTWYTYEKGNLIVDLVFYVYDGENYVNVFVCLSEESGSDDPEDPEIPDTGYANTDFKPSEKALFTQYIGAVIPFAPNDEYYVEGYYDEAGYEYGMHFYTLGNTQADFASYRGLYSAYRLIDTYTDDYGDTWYTYQKNDVIVDLSYYYYEGEYYIDVYVYSSLSKDLEEDDDPTGGNQGGTGGSENGDIEIITNKDAGLPEESDGVFDVDFTDAEIVKDVTDQGYYLEGCPTTGAPAVLVIPVEFQDVTASAKGYTIDNLKTAFNGASGTTDYYSVAEFYRISSYGQLNLNITVLDSWFRPAKNSSVYASAYENNEFVGDQIILDEALAYLATRMDLSIFDSDGNGTIDAVILINTLEIGEDNFYWAYRYWNTYADEDGDFYQYDGVRANDYVWASYQFLHDAGYGADGEMLFDDDVLNTYTFIHEFAHVLGADDYYDTSYEGEPPMNGYDVMDAMPGDHNAYTKFNFGWITSSRLVVTDDEITLTLEDFSESGDTIIIANNWDASLGAYQEYYVIVYYTNNGLNGDGYGYFEREGIVVYHVNAAIYKEIVDGETYYDVYNTNTDPSNEYGTEDNLIEFVVSADGDYTYAAGDALPTVTDDFGDTLVYTFIVESLTEDVATITFTKI